MNADFVVIGAGSAGCVLADRLSAGGRFSVLVLEAGGSDRRMWVRIPLGYGKTYKDPRVNWMYRTEPDPGLAGRTDYWPRGKVVGGSSSINAMVYIRGQAEDYDAGEREGNPGWGWSQVAPVFKAMEHAPHADAAIRGHGGPLHITDISASAHPHCRYFLDAAQEVGLPLNPDFNGLTQLGVGHYELTASRGFRCSAADAFLHPALGRPNLRLLRHAHVTAIVLKGDRAVGVRAVHRGEALQVSASREVILAAGAVNSPALLMLSGLGDETRLTRLGIPVHLCNPNIGRHLQDHIGSNHYYRCSRPSMNQQLRPWWGKLAVGARYLLNRSGPLALGVNHAGGFMASGLDGERADIQLYFQPFSTIEDRPGERPVLTPDPFPAVCVGFSTCRPKSRGRIALGSADPFAAPLIVPNSLSAPEDVEVVLRSLRAVRRLAATRAFRALSEGEILPGDGVDGDEALLADFRNRAGTVFHPCGTCRMGGSAQDSVVDPRTRAHGLRGLRVVDASIFPALVSGNTNAAVMMCAHRASTFILEDNGCQD